ncbi:hypothetical protein PAECIP111802_03038 [Paenibacillus allorhizosphaerae]|uniref:Uncharacterized protein n=1 Tax=Paenibacillus allorhizosphaerae TaxID=2849866 RepID=A0ABM8VI56_9BACL|nr:hypothetical protein PAECIP111802_03038 [Paenibacillus allorhizosphaerae]
MNFNWLAAEYLMKQQQLEIERSAREAWKWKMPKELSNRFLWRRQLTIANTTACCTPSCC